MVSKVCVCECTEGGSVRERGKGRTLERQREEGGRREEEKEKTSIYELLEFLNKKEN